MGSASRSPLTGTVAAIRARRLSAREAVESAIAARGRAHPAINAFALCYDDAARAQAELVDRSLKKGEDPGPLCGAPVALKDICDVAGMATRCGSRASPEKPIAKDSYVAAALRAAGAIILGKTSCQEYAYGGVTPQCRNPWNTALMTGGSSGGSAACLVGGSALGTIGTDTAGSIRIPASMCGVAGLKPTRALVPTKGIRALSWSLDHAGPMGRSVADVEALFDAFVPHAAADRRNQTWRIEGLRIGISDYYMGSGSDPEVVRLVGAAVEWFKDRGAAIVDLDLPHTDMVLPVGYGIFMPEASAYHFQRLRDQGEKFQEETRLLLKTGELVPATTYLRCLAMMQRFGAAWRALFNDIDIIMGPSLPVFAPAIDATEVETPNGKEGLGDALMRLNLPANLAGIPSLSVPCGFSPGGLPVGFQIMAAPYAEKLLLSMGRAYEEAHDWGLRSPQSV